MRTAFRTLARAAMVPAFMMALLAPLAVRADDGRPASDWSGGYLGAHAGWSFADAAYREPALVGFDFDEGFNGAAGGLLGGYNHRWDRFVAGVEADGSVNDATFGPADSGNGYIGVNIDWTARLRGRLGLPFGRTLPYVAAGLAVARVTVDDTDPGFGDSSATHLGWTVGAGVEHMIGDCLSLRLEYLYDDYGEESHDVPSPPGPFFPSYRARVDLTAHTLRVALSYRF